MRNRFFIVLLLSMPASSTVYSQTDTLQTARNLLYLEVFGIGGVGSVNYERVLFWKGNWLFAIRSGISTYHVNDYTNKFNPDILVPLSVNTYVGKNHKLELGAGQTFSNTVHAGHPDFKPSRKTNLHTNFTAGYRYQKNAGGFILRCAYTPLIEFNRHFRHWAGISFGYGF